METLKDIWTYIKMPFFILWFLFTIHTIILSIEGNIIPLMIVNLINIIIECYDIFIKKH